MSLAETRVTNISESSDLPAQKGNIEVDAVSPSDDLMHMARHLRKVLDETPDRFVTVAGQLGVARRKAYYLAEIDRAFDRLKVDRRRLARIGWSKLRIISGHINDRNSEELLKLAESNSGYRLAQLMKNEPTGAGVKTHAVLLRLSQEQYNLFREVLGAHGADVSTGGISGKEQALTRALTKLTKQ